MCAISFGLVQNSNQLCIISHWIYKYLSPLKQYQCSLKYSIIQSHKITSLPYSTTLLVSLWHLMWAQGTLIKVLFVGDMSRVGLWRTEKGQCTHFPAWISRGCYGEFCVFSVIGHMPLLVLWTFTTIFLNSVQKMSHWFLKVCLDSKQSLLKWDLEVLILT